MISVLRHCLLLLCFFASAVYAWQPQQGDIIFHTSRTSQSLAIQKATGVGLQPYGDYSAA